MVNPLKKLRFVSNVTTATTQVMLIFMLLVSTITTASAAQLTLKWQDPDEYRDIKPSIHETADNFKAFTFEQFEKFLTQLTKELPADHNLKISVTDLDLAGEVRLRADHLSEIRIVKIPFVPSMKFDYQLTDKQGKTIKSGKADINNRAMVANLILNSQQRNYKYEFAMLDKWFNKTLLEYTRHP